MVEQYTRDLSAHLDKFGNISVDVTIGYEGTGVEPRVDGRERYAADDDVERVAYPTSGIRG